MEIPIIRLEVDRMRHTIAKAFTEYELQISEEIRQAVDTYCSEDNIQRVVSDSVRVTLDRAIDEEITKYFAYGEGRKFIAKEVIKRLELELQAYE